MQMEKLGIFFFIACGPVLSGGLVKAFVFSHDLHHYEIFSFLNVFRPAMAVSTMRDSDWDECVCVEEGGQAGKQLQHPAGLLHL